MVPSKVTMCMHCSFTRGNEITNLETESRSRWLWDHDTAARPADLLAFVLAGLRRPVTRLRHPTTTLLRGQLIFWHSFLQCVAFLRPPSPPYYVSYGS